PALETVVILQFGAPIRVYDSGQTQRARRSPAAFVVGLDDRFTLTEFAGEQRGMEIKLTPMGARLLFGVPMYELTGRRELGRGSCWLLDCRTFRFRSRSARSRRRGAVKC